MLEGPSAGLSCLNAKAAPVVTKSAIKHDKSGQIGGEDREHGTCTGGVSFSMVS